MANTYSQIYIQIVFAVKGRTNLIPSRHRDELHKYITGIVTNKNQKLLAIFAMPDHVHILIGLKPNMSISNLVRDIKASSSKFISEKNWVKGKFSWQEGFGAFSYSKSQIDQVVKYILNQEEHHKKRTFKEEYLDILQKYDVAYDEQYLFDYFDNTNSWVD